VSVLDSSSVRTVPVLAESNDQCLNSSDVRSVSMLEQFQCLISFSAGKVSVLDQFQFDQFQRLNSFSARSFSVFKKYQCLINFSVRSVSVLDQFGAQTVSVLEQLQYSISFTARTV